jgi:YD repeat-containing protein
MRWTLHDFNCPADEYGNLPVLAEEVGPPGSRVLLVEPGQLVCEAVVQPGTRERLIAYVKVDWNTLRYPWDDDSWLEETDPHILNHPMGVY